MKNYLTSLLFKSALIERRIEDAQKSRSKDWLMLIRLKKIRLTIKDKILSLALRAQKKPALARVRKRQNFGQQSYS